MNTLLVRPIAESDIVAFVEDFLRAQIDVGSEMDAQLAPSYAAHAQLDPTGGKVDPRFVTHAQIDVGFEADAQIDPGYATHAQLDPTGGKVDPRFVTHAQIDVGYNADAHIDPGFKTSAQIDIGE
jgi:hypothetical protein